MLYISLIINNFYKIDIKFKKEESLYEANFIEPNIGGMDLNEFFNPQNGKARKTRDAWRNMTLNNIMRWVN